MISTLESISGCCTYDIDYINVKNTPIVKKNRLKNLIDYMIYCDGIEFVQVDPPMDIHKEAFKMKILYPKLNIEVSSNKIKISI
jgi:hypothetical protein